MAKTTGRPAGQGSGVAEPPNLASAQATLPWSLRRRIWASLLIAATVFLVFMGPVTNPISTEELTGPIGRFLAPVHQALYLSHGYRFFAPDPGPSHLLVYRLHHADDRVSEHRFPDTKKNWPRLLYHRWFMLSETIFAEHASQPDKESFERMQAALAQQIARFREAGHGKLADSLAKTRERQAQAFARAETRIRDLVQAVGKVLIQGTDATKIELFCQERVIPLPGDVLLGRKLNDPTGLSAPSKIGEFVPGTEEIGTQQGSQSP